MTTSGQTRTPDLDSRYGRTPSRRRRQRVLAWAAAAAVAITVSVWVVWVASDGTTGTLESRNVAHEILDDRSTSVTFEVSMAPGLSAACAVQVQNDAHAIVGWKLVEVPPSDAFTQIFATTVRTTELGVTGLIYRCWLT